MAQVFIYYIFILIIIFFHPLIFKGKSTLLSKLKNRHNDWVFIDEPVDTWTKMKNDEGKSLLEVFYNDKKRWSYTFQNCALLSRFNNIENTIKNNMILQNKYHITNQQNSDQQLHSNAHNNNHHNNHHNNPEIKKDKIVYVTERCLDTDHEVFAKMLFADGFLDRLEYDLYQQWYNMIKEKSTPLSAIIYMDTSPDICKERIITRGRQGEENIPISYLEKLDEFHKLWLSKTYTPIIKLNSISMDEIDKFVNNL